MVQRRVADLWRTVAAGVTETVNWADLYKTLLAELAGLVAQGGVDLFSLSKVTVGDRALA